MRASRPARESYTLHRQREPREKPIKQIKPRVGLALRGRRRPSAR
jgi:hypothetical protein